MDEAPQQGGRLTAHNNHEAQLLNPAADLINVHLHTYRSDDG